MAAPSPTTAATHHRVLLPGSALRASLSPAPSSALRIPARAARANRGRICVSAPTAPAASTVSPPASAAVAVEGKPTVLVAEKLGAAGLALLRELANVDCSYGLSPEELRAKISLCDALIVRSGTKVGRDVFEASGGRLRVIGHASVGIDSVDLTAATEHGCILVNAPTANTVAATEHGIALMCAMARNIAQADTSLMAVSMEEAMTTADFISQICPHPSTNKMLIDEAFAKMKKGVRIINVARGGVIDEDALVRALDAGIVAQAALDVFTKEPPAADSKLVLHENVTVTPHLGASTVEAQVLSELAPYVVLAEKLGRRAVQLVAGGGGIKSVKVTYASARAPDDLDTRLLRAMITKGVIEPISDAFANLVNADFTAKQRASVSARRKS
ncbi:hypothetical protein ZWY2020_012457 [Hordeum vulgare]|nr:hypothetical protein ZWY2020_012457 [Hordeum vulgare]